MSKKVLVLIVAGMALTASEARADIVVFKNGRTMSVKSCRVDADSATMLLREGGEVTFPATVIARVDPDEVPYPETNAAEVPAMPVAPVAPLATKLLPQEILDGRPFASLISTL